MKSIKAGETVNYLNRDHLLEEVTEMGVKLKRVNALPNEYSIYIRKGSERFFKIFSKDFDVKDIEVTDDEGVDVRLEKPSKVVEEDESNFNDFLVNLTKAHTTFNSKEEVTEFLKLNLFDFNDPLNPLKRFAISCWLNRRILVKFQTDAIEKYLPLIKNRVDVYPEELRLFVESALGDITEPSAKEVKSLVALIPIEDEELILSVIKGFDLPILWLNQIEVKQMLMEADDASKTKLKEKREIIMSTIKGLSNQTITEMLALFEAEADKRGLIETVEEDGDDVEEVEDINLEAMPIKELKAWATENDYDIAGLKTKKEILSAIEEQDEEDEIDEEDEEEIVVPAKKTSKKAVAVEEDEEDDEIDEDEIEDAEDDEEFEPYSVEELEEMTLKDLREIASEDFAVKGAEKMKKPALIEAIIEAQDGDDAEDEEDEEEEEVPAKKGKTPAKKAVPMEEDEEDEEDDEDEEDLDAEDEMPDYASMNLKQLREECKNEDIEFKGLSKEDLIDELEALWS